MSPPLHRSMRDGVVTLTLDVPEKRNALSMAMREQLRETLRRDEGDETVRALILTGANGIFCSGGDITLFGQGGESDWRGRLAILHEVVRLLVAGRKPVVAAVSGSAFGAGLSLAMAADYVVADRSARFSTSFARVGLFPDMGLLWTLPRRVGPALTRQLVMDARVLDVEAAQRLGIVDEVVDQPDLLEAAHRTALKASSLAPLTVAATKKSIAAGLDALLAEEMETQMKMFTSEDHKEAQAAFLSKRQPVFKGR